MLLTIIYIAVGLALTTIAIEIAADTLKKLHYFGRKIENVGNVAIWFGGKKYYLFYRLKISRVSRITMKALVKNLGDQFNLPTTVVKDLDLDNFVEQAIKVEEGEIETLRVSPLSVSSIASTRVLQPPPFDPDPDEFNGGYVDEPVVEGRLVFERQSHHLVAPLTLLRRVATRSNPIALTHTFTQSRAHTRTPSGTNARAGQDTYTRSFDFPPSVYSRKNV